MTRDWHPARLLTLIDAAVDGARVEDFGGRVAALVAAQRRGVSIAESWVVPADAFREAVRSELPPGHDPGSLLRAIHKPSGLERAGRARERLLALTLPFELREELEGLCSKLGPSGSFIVSASPTLDDDSVAALAGLDARIAGVRSQAGLEAAILRIWSGAVDSAALDVLRAHRCRDLAVAVLVQRIPSVVASGLALTRERRAAALGGGTAWDGPSLVAAAWGLGSPVRDGQAPHDGLRIGADGGLLGRRVVVKPERWVPGSELPAVEPVEAEARARCSVADASLGALAGLARKLEPEVREVRWVIGDDAAPLVVDVFDPAGGGFPDGGGAATVWSRAGLGDLLPAVATPLTASLVESFCETGLRQALGALGGDLPRNAQLVGRVHGRHFLDLSALVPALDGVPGIDPAAVLELVRSPVGVDLARLLEIAPRRGTLASLSMAAVRLLVQERRLEEAVQRFERDAEQQRRWLGEMDLAILPDDSLVTTLRETHDFVQTTGRLLLRSSLGALAAHLVLKSALTRAVPDRAARLAQTVLAGIADLPSARPALALAHVVEIARNDPAARPVLTAGARELRELPAGPARRALDGWLEAFGERGLAEVEVCSPRWTEAPAPLLDMLRAGLGAEATDPEQRLSRVRAAADAELAALENGTSALDLALIRPLLARARGLARCRERLRVWIVRTLAMTRVVALEVDRRLRRLDSGLGEGSAFFLSYPELLSATGRTRADLGPLIRMRRARFESDRERPDPPDSFVGVPPRWAALPFDAHELRGSAASPGVAIGRVRVVRPGVPLAVEAGEILVVRAPDVGLSPLFFVAAAVVADQGSALSHAAVVAREIGVPAVLGVPGATISLHEGERVRVDGDRGLVERLDA